MLQNSIYIIHFFNLISRKKVSRRDAKKRAAVLGERAMGAEEMLCIGVQSEVFYGGFACAGELDISREWMDAVYLARKPRRRKARCGFCAVWVVIDAMGAFCAGERGFCDGVACVWRKLDVSWTCADAAQFGEVSAMQKKRAAVLIGCAMDAEGALCAGAPSTGSLCLCCLCGGR